MSEQLRESLSAVMDGEADAFELRRVLDESRSDSKLRELWHRQHLVRDILRGDEIVHQLDLRARLLAEMEELSSQEGDEPIHRGLYREASRHARALPWRRGGAPDRLRVRRARRLPRVARRAVWQRERCGPRGHRRSRAQLRGARCARHLSLCRVPAPHPPYHTATFMMKHRHVDIDDVNN